MPQGIQLEIAQGYFLSKAVLYPYHPLPLYEKQGQLLHIHPGHPHLVLSGIKLGPPIHTLPFQIKHPKKKITW